MSSLENYLGGQRDELRRAGLYRSLHPVESPQDVRIKMGGRTLLNFSSNNYLGLANHPLLREAGIRALEHYGAGTGASRLISGSQPVHGALEEQLAAFKSTQSALTFSSGYATAMGTVGALVGREDVVVVDKLSHACIIDAARLSGAKLRVFRHNDLGDLERILQWADARAGKVRARPKVLVVTESVFSMDGDCAPLKSLVDLKERYGAWLMVDEAHATGVFGPQGAGCAQQCGVADQIDVQMGTLGKALGAAGGYICGSRNLVDHLLNRARSFIFSTAPVPAAAAAAAAGVNLARSPEGQIRRQRLWERIHSLARLLNRETGVTLKPTSPILPWIVGEETRAMEVADQLQAAGLYAPAIRFPTVARGSARLRLTVTADHSEVDLHALAGSLTGLTDPAS